MALKKTVFTHRVNPATKRYSFLNFPYVCPEPVLVKRSHLYMNGSQKDRFFTCDRRPWPAAQSLSGVRFPLAPAQNGIFEPFIFSLKTIILPRQARDKQKDAVFRTSKA